MLYATLVFDAGTPTSASSPAEKNTITASRFATLPEAAASFGAVASGDWLYIYGGHIAPTHTYSTEAVSGKFNRLNLADGKTWEALPGGPVMQGMNLAVHDRKIYRVGGMIPRNRADEPEDIWSTSQCAIFDPSIGAWQSFPDLPEPRSSHDVAVAGDTLYVVGGWNLRGGDQTHWADSMLAIDLTAKSLAWRAVPQPFKRRALIAASLDGKIYCIGGFDENADPSSDVDIFDTKTNSWSKGSALPGPAQNGFGPAACTLNGQLFVSVADGSLYRLSKTGNAWEKIGAGTPRIVHRLAPRRAQVLIIGGAADGKNFDLIEAIIVPPASAAEGK